MLALPAPAHLWRQVHLPARHHPGDGAGAGPGHAGGRGGRMKILHVEAGKHLYGGARQVLYIVEGLAARGVTNLLACPAGKRACMSAMRSVVSGWLRR